MFGERVCDQGFGATEGWESFRNSAEPSAKLHVPFALLSNLNTDTLVKILKINIDMWLRIKAEVPLRSVLPMSILFPSPT